MYSYPGTKQNPLLNLQFNIDSSPKKFSQHTRLSLIRGLSFYADVCFGVNLLGISTQSQGRDILLVSLTVGKTIWLLHFSAPNEKFGLFILWTLFCPQPASAPVFLMLWMSLQNASGKSMEEQVVWDCHFMQLIQGLQSNSFCRT